MSDTRVPQVLNHWRELIEQRQALLAQIQNELVELEAGLAEQLAAINAFEFKLRSRVKTFITHLEALEQEISALLAQLHRDAPESHDGDWTAWSLDDDGAAAAGEYRYRESIPTTPPPQLDPDQGEQLKRLYRQLARRFHPDMAFDEASRAYCTQIMMAINAAYAAGDLEKLQELALEPDAASHIDHAHSDEQLAEALLNEIERCRRRIREIRQELDTLRAHESARLMRKEKDLALQGRELLAEIVEQLKEEITRKKIERDVVKSEIDEMRTSGISVHTDAFADVVWDLSLENAFDEDPDITASEWLNNRSARYVTDDDILDDSD